MRQYFRKADIILLITLIAAGLAMTALLSVRGAAASGAGASGAMVVIKSGGSTVRRYPISEDSEIIMPAPGSPDTLPATEAGGDECTQYVNYNTVRISGGKVSVTEASCKNQVCVRHSPISKPGETIVCLPNRLVVSIEAGGDSEGGGYDSITS